MYKMINKAVFPVAGIGSRLLPATKASPKEMLPIVDKPLIQYIVEEALSTGIKELIFITSKTKHAIEDHFEPNHELERKLAEDGKQELLDTVHDILPKGVSCAYIHQSDLLGLGHAILCAQPFINNEPFAVLLPDDLIDTGKGESCLQQMLGTYYKTQHSVLAMKAVPDNQTHQYGIVEIENLKNNSGEIKTIIEKPKQGQAPSNLAVVGRYILTPNIFSCLKNTKPGRGGEIQLTDGIAQLLQMETVYGSLFTGLHYDCGNKLGYLQAIVNYAIKHPEIGVDFKAFLASVNLREQDNIALKRRRSVF